MHDVRGRGHRVPHLLITHSFYNPQDQPMLDGSHYIGLLGKFYLYKLSLHLLLKTFLLNIIHMLGQLL